MSQRWLHPSLCLLVALPLRLQGLHWWLMRLHVPLARSVWAIPDSCLTLLHACVLGKAPAFVAKSLGVGGGGGFYLQPVAVSGEQPSSHQQVDSLREPFSLGLPCLPHLEPEEATSLTHALMRAELPPFSGAWWEIGPGSPGPDSSCSLTSWSHTCILGDVLIHISF